MRSIGRASTGWLCLAVALFCPSAQGGAAAIAPGFRSGGWDLQNAEIVDHLGREALAGTALLEDVEFSDGVIEVDMAVDGRRSYPGIIFRVQSNDEYERFYLRPHRAGLYPDALQYVPVFNGVAGWQLYHGDGFTAGATLPRNQWIHVRIEVRGAQARVYLDNAGEPALVIHELKHGNSKGAVGVLGPIDGTAFFSNFRYEMTDELEFERPPPASRPAGILAEWDVSKPFRADQLDPTTYRHFFAIFHAEWQSITAETSGLINISKHFKRPGPEPHRVLAKTVVRSDEEQDVRLTLGYSDEVTVFLNGTPSFSGISGYRSRDPSFVGVVGLYDTLYLPLRAGLNEILLIVTESFGGWGFVAQIDPPLATPIKDHDALTKIWETPADFKVPESVLYDPKREVLYVSNFNRVGPATPGQGFLSILTPAGQIDTLRWITSLDGPCGMAIHNDRLYVVESTGQLVEIDIDEGEVAHRHRVPDVEFLNDIAIDQHGVIYMSNTSRVLAASDVLRCADGRMEVWQTGSVLHRSNGLFIHDNHLLVGNSGDGFLKRINLTDGRIGTITCLGAGVNDGIRVDAEQNYLVSHWEGRLYRISPSGNVVEILDTSHQGRNCADFEYMLEENLLVIPTFLGNTVAAYRLRG